MNPNDNKNNKNNKPGGNWRGVASLVGWALLLTIIFSYASSVIGSTGRQASSINVEYGEFQEMVESGQVARVEFDNAEDILLITPEEGYSYTAEDGTVYTKTEDGYTYMDAAGQEQTAHLELFTVRIQSNDAVIDFLNEYGVEGVDKEYQAPVNPVLAMLVSYVLPFVLIFLMFSLVMRWMAKKGGMGGMGGIGGVGKANAKVYMEKSTGVTFKDVAGQDEAKESLTEIIDFLHNPQKYTEIGAKLPKGALLVGPPGTGKTLLAKAVAGEANVPFFSISGSDFVEMFVGVGADLANLVNEAALRAVRKGRKLVTQEDLLAAFELVIAGTEKKGSVLTEFEKKLVAYHEVGHAMVAYKQKNTEPVQKITIVPHTQGSLGYTLLMPEEDKTELRTRDELMAKIMVSMGGRAAEEVVMNTMTNGASQDIQDATNVARNMVAMFGMSDEFGMMALASRRNQYLDGGYGMDCAQDTAARMDQAVKDILDQCYQQAVEVIKASREDMDKVVAYLLEKETITGAEMVAIIEGRDPELVENPYASTRAEDKAFRPSSPETIEAPAKKVHMISQKIESPEEPAQEGQPENPVSDPSPSGGDAPQESGSTPSEPPKDTP